MKFRKAVALFTAVSVGALVLGCGGDNGNGSDGEGPATTREVKYSYGFEQGVEDEDLNFISYMMTVNDESLPWLEVSSSVARTGSKSLTAPAELDSDISLIAGIERVVSSIDTFSAGMEFYIMADDSKKADFIMALGKTGSSGMSSYYYFAMGFTKEDSVKYEVYASEDFYIEKLEPGVESTNVAKMEKGKWYKCNIEVDLVPPQEVKFFLDNKLVGSAEISGEESAINGVDMIIGMCTDAGEDGWTTAPKYYVDDVVTYQHNVK